MCNIKVNEIECCNICENEAQLQEVLISKNKIIYGKYLCLCGNQFNIAAGTIDIITKKELRRKSIGELLDILYKIPSNKPVRTNIANQEYIKYVYGSDRGSYKNLYIDLSEENTHKMDLNTLINLLNLSLDTGVMFGYKGGEYAINKNTLVTLSNYGYAGKYVIDIVEEDDCIRLIAEVD